MTIGIYCIQHIKSGKRYIGKSKHIEKRFIEHKHILSKPKRDTKLTNRYLYNAVQKYGWKSFKTSILESFEHINDELITDRELYWIEYFKATEHEHGYNLRKDSSTKMIIHPETLKIKSRISKGNNNPNYGNRWSESMKQRMSNIKKEQHASGEIYNEEWRIKQGKTSSKFWKENPDIKNRMAKKVAKSKQKYDFIQLDSNMNILKVWVSIEEIIKENPNWKWQNIYSVCNGYKKRIYGYVWRKVLKHEAEA